MIGKKKIKIAMIIAKEDFRDEELFIPWNLFLLEGFEVKIVSAEKGKAIGEFGGVVDIDLSADKLKVEDYSAIVFIGGEGMAKNMDNQDFWRIAQEAVKKNLILAAICIAPTVLAKSGVLDGRVATVWSNDRIKEPIKILKENGAIYKNLPVVVDGRIITANGSKAARKFAEKIIMALSSNG